jgi:outer membrane protein insertion porin family
MLRRLIGGILLAHAGIALGQGAGDFVVGDIRVEGLQRIAEGTVYNYLPVNIGDRLDQRRVQEAVRALFATGFFNDIEMRRDGATLVIAVLERPSIESFEITGKLVAAQSNFDKVLQRVNETISTGIRDGSTSRIILP